MDAGNRPVKPPSGPISSCPQGLARVHKETVVGEGVVDEHLIAITEAENAGSQRVLLKSGFERFREYVEVDGSQTKNLIAFRFVPKKQ
ncbi:uncharacterized protein N7515_007956 [Penicillium bovifimosum]|uniref:N-acetyltransferase domain-containing protein n=1 Tax=Penicillium bovifimosum TaxID=126998 RepID=A0A9W9GM42_9EURO|nr:uncharacterized protein N7515_007956 [Penicillium bovifimosum]KAJ5124131.1 hypothetical protein N7515_007956 [Penicillium bovifimosum]